MLSLEGRICLIKSVISALPLFYFSFFKAPIVVCNQIRRILARFLWGWGFEERKIAWVKWEKICCPVAAGGLGIKDIGCFNDALLSKLKLRLESVEEGLWRDVLEARYGSWRNLDITLVHRNQSLWWKDLCGFAVKEQKVIGLIIDLSGFWVTRGVLNSGRIGGLKI